MEINKIKKAKMIIVLMALLVLSCHNHKGENHSHNHSENKKLNQTENQEHHKDEHTEGGVHLTKEQAKTIKLELGNFIKAKTTGYVEANGVLGLPPNAYASVNAKVDGVIMNSTKIVEGDKIKKGQIIAYLENPRIIQKQQEYLEAKAQLIFLNKELERQQKLFDNQAGALGHLQKAASERDLYRAKTQGLKQYLNFLGISTAKLNYTNIRSKVPILAPMNGYATRVNYHNGMTVSTNQELIEIINDEQLHLELKVFESDVTKIKEGQKISYTIAALGNEIYEGEVTGVGKEFSEDSKTIVVHGHIAGKTRPRFIKDLYLQAKIWLDDETGTILPKEALIREGDKDYIYVTENTMEDEELEFRKILVKLGNKLKGAVAVSAIDTIHKNEKIVINGAYYVYAKSVSGELEHSH